MYIPEEIARRKDLNSNDKMLYSVYQFYCTKGKGFCQARNELIGETIGLSVQAVQRAKKHLLEKQLIKVDGVVYVRLNHIENDTHNNIVGIENNTIENNTHNNIMDIENNTPDEPKGIENDMPTDDRGIENNMEGYRKQYGRGIENDTHNREGNRESIEDIGCTYTEGTVSKKHPDLTKFYLSFGKFLSKAPDMGLKDMYTNFGIYKKKLEDTLQGEELRTNLASITEQFNSVVDEIKRNNPVHKVVTETDEFDTLVSRAFVFFDKWKIDQDMPKPAQLQTINQNLSDITKENGQDTADTYFKLYVNTVLSWGVPTDKLVRNWNCCMFNERYRITELDGTRYQ